MGTFNFFNTWSGPQKINVKFENFDSDVLFGGLSSDSKRRTFDAPKFARLVPEVAFILIYTEIYIYYDVLIRIRDTLKYWENLAM